MTIEEAIEMLKKDKEQRGNCFISDALDMAIKALEQESCEDAVSKEDVLSEIIRFSTEEGASVECQQLYCDVNNMPSVTPREPRKGHWIFKKTAFDKFGNTVECSSCHKKWKTYDEVRWRKENKYCPNCGTDMSEVEE